MGFLRCERQQRYCHVLNLQPETMQIIQAEANMDMCPLLHYNSCMVVGLVIEKLFNCLPSTKWNVDGRSLHKMIIVGLPSQDVSSILPEPYGSVMICNATMPFFIILATFDEVRQATSRELKEETYIWYLHLCIRISKQTYYSPMLM